MKIKQFENLISPYLKLSGKDKEFIFETFRVNENFEDNPDNMDDRLISL